MFQNQEGGRGREGEGGTEEEREGRREGGGWRKGGRDGGMEGWREGGSGGRNEGWDGQVRRREGGRDRGEGQREGGRKGGRKGGRQGGKGEGWCHGVSSRIHHPNTHLGPAVVFGVSLAAWEQLLHFWQAFIIKPQKSSFVGSGLLPRETMPPSPPIQLQYIEKYES